MKSEYRGRSGNIKKEDAKVYGKCVEELMKKKGGKLVPKDLVDYAKSASSPLHNYFEWDDSEAGKKWRLAQARDLMSNLVEIKFVENKEVETRSFFNVNRGKPTQCYVTREKALKTKSYRQELIANIISHMENTSNLLRILQEQD